MTTVSEKETSEAVAFRQGFGLRADLTWVRAVAGNPAAQIGIPEFGFPLMPDEFADLMRRRWDPDLLAQVNRYGNLFPDDYAGAHINLKSSGVLISFKNQVNRHRAALSNLVPDGSVLEVAEVEWSLKDLLAFVDRVEAEEVWFDAVGLVVNSSENIIDNKVHVRFRGPKEAGGLIQQHFGNPSWLMAEWIGPLPWEGPRADLTIEVTDTDGQPVPQLRVEPTPIDPNVSWSGDGVWGTDSAGTCILKNLPATLYKIKLLEYVADEDRYNPNPIKTFRVELKPGGSSTRVVVPERQCRASSPTGTC